MTTLKKALPGGCKRPRGRYSALDVVFNALNYGFFAVFTFACVFPFYYLFINTISDNQLVSLGQIMFVPKGIHFENYVQVFKIEGLASAALTSVARTVLGTAWTVVGSAFLGYLVTKREMWRRTLFYRAIIITMYFNAGLIPWYMNMRSLGFLDNFWAYVIPGLVAPYNVILVKTFIEGIPASLEESASIEGAGYVTAFFRIIFPLITPIIATLAIFGAVGHWNSFVDTMVLMPGGKYYTLQYVLYKYQSEASALAALMRTTQSSTAIANLSTKQTALSVKMTVSMVVVAPILLVYPYFQRFFVKGIMIGAVKG